LTSSTANSLKSRSSRLLLAAVGIAYPLVVYFGLRSFSPMAIGAALLPFLVLRLVYRPHDGPSRAIADVLVIAGGLALAVVAFSPLMGLKAYPIFVSFGLAVLFGYTLLWPPTVIERIARLYDPELPDAARPYLIKVTAAWISFFLVNAGLSAWTAASGSLELWTLYNGLISYLLMGVLFTGEFIVRQFVRHRHGETP